MTVNAELNELELAVAEGARLSGTGSLGSFVADGIVALGNSIETLNVAESATFQPGSIFEVEVAADGRSDQVVANTATINGGTLAIVTADTLGSYVDGQRSVIVDTANGVGGQFTNVTKSFTSLFLDFDPIYTANQILLEVDRQAFATAAGTFNQTEVAGALDGIGSTGNGLILQNTLVGLTTVEQAGGALNQLSGESHASAKTALIQDSRFVRDAAQDRINGAFAASDGATSIQPLGFGPGVPVIADSGGADVEAWMRVYGSDADADGDGNAAGIDYDTSGFFIGLDGMATDTVSFGVLGGYSTTDLDVGARNATAKTDSWHLGLYAGTELYGLTVKGGAAYAWHGIDMVRQVAFPGFTDRPVSEYDASTGQVFGEVSYDVALESATVSPFGGLAYVHHRTDPFTETGGAAALTAIGIDLDTWFSEIGVRGSMLIGTDLVLRGEAGWRHAFGDTRALEAFSVASSSSYLAKGAGIDEDLGFLEIGLDYRLNRWATVGASFEGQYGSDTTSNSARADLTFRF